MTKDLQTSCILCGSTHIIKIGKRHEFQSTDEINGYSKYVTDISNFDRDIINCQNCGLSYVSPSYGEAEFLELYDHNKYYDFYMSLQNKSITIETLSDIWINQFTELGLTEWINNYNKTHKKGPKTIDVGCGNGQKLYTLNKMGCDVIGIEIISKFCEYIEENFQLPVIQCDLRDYKPTEKFDIVYSSHNIEHLTSPVEYLELLRKFLSDDGILFIETPWAEDNGVYSSRYRDIFHTLFFNHTSLLISAIKAGFTIENINYINFGTKGSYHKYIQILLKPDDSTRRDIKTESFNRIIQSIEDMASKEINWRITLEVEKGVLEQEKEVLKQENCGYNIPLLSFFIKKQIAIARYLFQKRTDRNHLQ